MTSRGFPNNCPYCGDVDLWPHEAEPAAGPGGPGGPGGTAGHGEWECRSCLRAFRLKMLGMVRPATSGPAADPTIDPTIVPTIDRASQSGGAR